MTKTPPHLILALAGLLAVLATTTAAAADDAAKLQEEAVAAEAVDGSVYAFGFTQARLSTGKRIEVAEQTTARRRLRAFTEKARLRDGIYGQTFLSLDGGSEEELKLAEGAPLRPAAIAGISPTNVAPQVRWLAVKGAVAYRVRRDEKVVGEVKETVFTDAKAKPDATYSYTVTALDAEGNESRRSRAAAITYDLEAPDAPTLEKLKKLLSVAPVLRWRRAAGVDRFRIKRDGLVIAETRLSLFRDELVADDGLHKYELIAVDAAGNESAESKAEEVELDTKPPETPDLQAASPTQVPELHWPEIKGARVYLVLRDGKVVEKTEKPEFRDEGLAEGTYGYQVEAVDEAGNVSDKLSAIEVVVDTTPPATPRVRAAAATSEVPTLTWRTKRGDAVRYEIDRGEKRGIVETTETSYVDKEAERQGEYTYSVTAIDAAGNRSEPSKPVRVVVDRDVLDAPADLKADESPTKESPSLHWGEVKGAEQYIVLRDGEEIGAQRQARLRRQGGVGARALRVHGAGGQRRRQCVGCLQARLRAVPLDRRGPGDARCAEHRRRGDEPAGDRLEAGAQRGRLRRRPRRRRDRSGEGGVLHRRRRP